VQLKKNRALWETSLFVDWLFTRTCNKKGK